MTNGPAFVLQVQRTYEAHVSERRAYGMVPLPYETWKSWHDDDVRRFGHLDPTLGKETPRDPG